MLDDVLLTIGGMSFLVLTITQTIKVQLGLKGRGVFFVALIVGLVLGMTFAAGGLLEFKVLRRFPDLLSGGALGLLSGFGGAGTKDTVSGWGTNWARAQGQVRADERTQAAKDATDLPDASMTSYVYPDAADYAPMDYGPAPR